MRLELPSDIRGDLEYYRARVEQKFDAYVEEEKERQENADPMDPDTPGVTEDFLRKFFLGDTPYDERDFDVHQCGKFFALRRPGKSIQDNMKVWLETQFPSWKFDIVSGHYLYPAKGGFMGWHTNANTPGRRIYISHAKKNKGGFFRYYDRDQDKVVTDWDSKGWNVRSFLCSGNLNELYWHCVYAETDRLSIGIRLVK